MKKVSVIIVNYITCEILEKCLQNLEGVYPNMEVIVVDNGSKDGSVEMIREKFPWVILIALGENVGLAKGSNIGLEKATGDYTLYLGADAFPEKNTISSLVDYFEQNPQVGIATCKLVLRDGKIDMDAHRGFPTPWASLTHFVRLDKLFPKSRIFNQYFQGYKNLNEPHEIDLCISHFMMIRKQVFESVGKWDEDYFLYGEDVDLCYRAKQAGWKVMYLPQWKSVHYKGSSVGIRKETADVTKATKEQKIIARKSTTQAMKIFYRKHYSDKYPKLLTNLVFLGIDLLEKLRSLRN